MTTVGQSPGLNQGISDQVSPQKDIWDEDELIEIDSSTSEEEDQTELMESDPSSFQTR